MEQPIPIIPSIGISILQAIKESQAQHGLKYENYQRYRTYCSRRLHRLRRSLNVHQGVPPSAKARHQRAKKLVDITSEMVVEAGQKIPEYSERMLLILLYLAERAWAHAMQLKQEVSDQPRKKFHLVRRLKKAMQFAQKFDKLCHEPDSPCQKLTQTEATGYAAYISGLYYFETEQWQLVKEHLTKALEIYFMLSIWADYRERIDEIKASLRYCNFNLPKDPNQKEVPFWLSGQKGESLTFRDVASHRALNIIAMHQNPSQADDKKEPETKIKVDDEDEDDENWDDACDTFE